jgi:multicomponent Na+:H+ antiporter subunit E
LVTVKGLSLIIRRIWGLSLLAIWTTGAIAVASLKVARDIINPSAALQPGVVIVPLHLHTSTQLAVWTSLINLTPGTLVVQISADLKEAWVHSLYAGDPQELKHELHELQNRVCRAFATLTVEVM